MKIIRIDDLNNFNNNDDIINNTIITIGVFDGIHLAHKALIDTMIKYKQNHNVYIGVMTFDPHPDFVLSKRDNDGYITPINQKIQMFEDLGIDYLFLINFNKSIASLDYESFYDKFLKDFKFFVVGSDFRFGYKALGDAKYLKEKKNESIILDEIKKDDEKISSSLIRELLNKGEIKKVNNILGHPYELFGKVVKGAHIGTSLGFPTANIDLSDDYMSIKSGVYLSKVCIKDDKHEYFGMCNIGNNPTLNYVIRKRLEVHIIDYNYQLYDKEISVKLIDYLREEKKFDNKEELINQIKKDRDNAIEILNVNRGEE